MTVAFPYAQLTGVLCKGLAKFLKEKGAASSFKNLQAVPENSQEAMWLARIVLHMQEGPIPIPAGGKDIYPVIYYSFVSMYTPSTRGWPLPKPLNDRMVEKATKIVEGTSVRTVERGTLLVSDIDLAASGVLPWDLVLNKTTHASGRIYSFIDEKRALLGTPLFYDPNQPFEIWRSDYYERRMLNGFMSLQWSGEARGEGEANILGNLLLEYFTTTCNEDLLYGCLWGNKDLADHEINLWEIGSLTPSERILERQEVLERRDLTIRLRAAALVERKRPPIESVYINMASPPETVMIGPDWLLPS